MGHDKKFYFCLRIIDKAVEEKEVLGRSVLLRHRVHGIDSAPFVKSMAVRPLLVSAFCAAFVSVSASFFSVEKDVNDRWWFMRDGQRFFLTAVTSVNRGGRAEGAIGPYYNATLGRYGADNETFRTAVTARLRHWGFNSLGAWSTPEFWSDASDAIPYTVDLEASRLAPASVLINGDMPDVYDPAWLGYVDARARAVTAATRTAPYNLVGYFADNELGWPSLCTAFNCPPPSDAPLAPSAARPGLLQQCLSLPPNRSAYAAAWAWLLPRHGGSLAALSSAWALPQALSTESDVARLYANRTINSAVARADDAAWLGPDGYGGAYFQATAAALRTYDSAHLIMGCKFGGPVTDSVYVANARFHDVVSVDNYRYNMAERMRAISAATGGAAPILVAEYSWIGSGCPIAPGSDELGCCAPGADPAVGGFPCPVPGETPTANLTNLDRMYCNGAYALAEAARIRDVAGWTWYRWVDEGPASPFTQLGLVDIDDKVKATAVATIAAINADVEMLHAAGPLTAAHTAAAPRGAAGGTGKDAQLSLEPPTGAASPAWLAMCPYY